MSSDSVKQGLTIAKDNIVDIFQFIINWIAVPLISLVILGFIVFFIGLAARKHKAGDDYQSDIRHIVIAIIVLVVVGTFPLWGWAMINMSSSASASTTAVFLYTRMC